MASRLSSDGRTHCLSRRSQSEYSLKHPKRSERVTCKSSRCISLKHTIDADDSESDVVESTGAGDRPFVFLELHFIVISAITMHHHHSTKSTVSDPRRPVGLKRHPKVLCRCDPLLSHSEVIVNDSTATTIYIADLLTLLIALTFLDCS